MCIQDLISIIASLATITALIFAIIQYLLLQRKNKIAFINIIFEELKHNLNIRAVFTDFKKYDTYKCFLCDISKKNKIFNYPNPTDSNETKDRLYKYINLSTSIDKLPYANEYMPIYNDAIKNVLITGLCYKLIHPRILLNLGHLNFGINRNNLRLKSFNVLLSNQKDFPKEVVTSGFFSDYLDWVHFRTIFLIIDLINIYPIRYFNDKSEYRRIKTLLKTTVHN